MFRGALAGRRCLLPADAFYEWKAFMTASRPMRSRAPTARRWPSPRCGRAGVTSADVRPLVAIKDHEQSACSQSTRQNQANRDWPASDVPHLAAVEGLLIDLSVLMFVIWA